MRLTSRINGLCKEARSARVHLGKRQPLAAKRPLEEAMIRAGGLEHNARQGSSVEPLCEGIEARRRMGKAFADPLGQEVDIEVVFRDVPLALRQKIFC
jgi:hypothetical protein